MLQSLAQDWGDFLLGMAGISDIVGAYVNDGKSPGLAAQLWARQTLGENADPAAVDALSAKALQAENNGALGKAYQQMSRELWGFPSWSNFYSSTLFRLMVVGALGTGVYLYALKKRG